MNAIEEEMDSLRREFASLISDNLNRYVSMRFLDAETPSNPYGDDQDMEIKVANEIEMAANLI